MHLEKLNSDPLYAQDEFRTHMRRTGNADGASSRPNGQQHRIESNGGGDGAAMRDDSSDDELDGLLGASGVSCITRRGVLTVMMLAFLCFGCRHFLLAVFSDTSCRLFMLWWRKFLD